MKQVLAVDIGTGTQDIFLLRVGLSPENGYKLVLPSPTMRIRREIQEATQRGEPLLLTGVTMGGGPCHWAAEDHIRAGYSLYATPDAAKTFNDDLEWVESEMGVQVISEDEVARLTHCQQIVMRDFDWDSLYTAFQAFGVTLDPQVLAIAVFDHGAAPPGISDRTFRFDFITKQLQRSNQLSTFSFPADQLPPELTRLAAVRNSASSFDGALILMDTAPAAILGATLDPKVASFQEKLIVNIGNYHTLAFRLEPEGVAGVFEHHTGMLDQHKLEALLNGLALGTLTNRQVFDDMGHGTLILNAEPMNDQPGVIVTGPRRSMMRGSPLRPYFAVPLGDMMLTGCFGLLVAAAEHLPKWRDMILNTLNSQDAETAPWDIDEI